MAHDPTYRWRAPVTDAEVNGLTRSYGGRAEDGWWDRIRPHSLGWATAHLDDGTAVGFANVAWDGGDHAFLLDPKVRLDLQRRGIATGLVRLAVDHAAEAGCEWLHVDFRDELAPFYFDACGFSPTAAGVLRLREE
jgi:GNAT superfamily N-acetyltransferase